MIIRKKWMKKKTIFLSVMVLAGALFTSNLLARSYTMECKGGILKVQPLTKMIQILPEDGQFRWLDRSLNDAEKDSLNKHGLLGALLNCNFDILWIDVEKNKIKQVFFGNGTIKNLVDQVLNGEKYFLQVENRKGKLIITKVGL